MNQTTHFCRLLPVALLVSATVVRAQTPSFEESSQDSPNRFTLNYRIGFNINASFKNVGSLPRVSHMVPDHSGNPTSQAGNPGPDSGHGFNRTYDDGYNYVDSTGNQLGYTRYWGYDSSSQLQGNSIVMHSTTSSGATIKDRDDDPVPGFEIGYNRELFRKGRWRIGFEATFGYSDLNIGDSHPVAARANRINDAFALPPIEGGGFVLPPPAPYSGPYNLGSEGNPVLSDAPTRTRDVLAESITGNRSFGADLFGFKLGPYFELPVSRRVAIELSGGFALVYAYSSLSFNETAIIGGITPTVLTERGAGNHDDLLPGAYVTGTFSVLLRDDWCFVAGAQFQDVGDYTHREGHQKAVLDLNQMVFVTVGLSRSF